jgi:hypothetical protein
MVTLVKGPFFLKTCEINEKKRKIKGKLKEKERGSVLREGGRWG